THYFYDKRHHNNVLQYLAYSSDITPTDYHLFRSMQHALSDTYFKSVNEIR
ncbi:hypothetical protein EAI_12047, partial [Harpegnathos saltator]